jgi:circadian clock protein KaiB
VRIEPLDTESSAPFLLFVAGDSPNSRAAIANLHRALVSLDLEPATVEIVDVFERPDITARARVMVTPALVRRSDPRLRILGDLSVPGQITDFLQ